MKRSRLETIVDVGSAIGTAGILGGTIAVLSHSPEIGLISFVLAEGGYVPAFVASDFCERDYNKVHKPRLYWMGISLPALIIDTIYVSYAVHHYLLPGVLNWLSQTF